MRTIAYQLILIIFSFKVFASSNYTEILILYNANGINLHQDFGLAIYNEETEELYLELDSLSRILHLNIARDESNNHVGWFLHINNSFSTNYEKNTITSKGETFKYSENDVVVYNNLTYIKQDLLEKVLFLQSDFSYSNLVLSVVSEESFPIERELKQDSFSRYFEHKEGVSKDYETYNNLFSLPVADVNLGFSRTDASESYSYGTRLGFNFLGLNTIFSHQSNIYNFGNSTAESYFNYLTFSKSFHQDSDTGRYLKYFTFGDINSPKITLSSGAANGVGISASSLGELYKSNPDNSVNIQGLSNPGWDVYLYYKEALIAIGVVGTDGRYAFNNIQAITSGLNVFNVKIYSPFGLVEEKTFKFLIGSLYSRENELNYKVSYIKNNSSLFNESNTYINQMDSTTNVELFYGIKDNINIVSTYSLQETPNISEDSISDNNIHNATLGLHTVFSGVSSKYIFSKSSFADSSKPGMYFDVSTNLLRGYLSSSYLNNNKNYNNLSVVGTQFVNEEILNQYSSYWKMPFLNKNISYRFRNLRTHSTYKENTIKNNRTASRVFVQLNQLFSLSAENEFNTIKYLGRKDNYNTTTVELRTSFSNINASLSNVYNHYPNKELDSTGVIIKHRFKANPRFSHSINYNYRHSYNFYNAKYNLSYSSDFGSIYGYIGKDNFNSFTAGLSYYSSLYINPYTKSPKIYKSASMVNSSSFVSLVYIDNDMDKQYNPEIDEALEGVTIKASSGSVATKTNEHGNSLVTGITPNTQITIDIDPNSLDSIFLTPNYNEYNVIPEKSNLYKLDLPLVPSGDLEGVVPINESSIYFVILLGDDAATVKRELVSKDGFFLFERVPYGKYTLIVNKRETGSSFISNVSTHEVEIQDEINYFSQKSS